MTPLRALKLAVAEFEKRNCQYALIGGHAASLYRANERLTRDVDFALVAIPEESSREVAEEIIRAIGLTPTLGFVQNNQKCGKELEMSLVTSTPGPGRLTGVIDILLPKLPWVAGAVQRAQSNKIDLGFAAVPVITPEDLIVAKCYALRNAPDRFQDLDDLKDIFGAVSDIDFDYLALELKALGLRIPKALRPFTPATLKRLCK